MCSECYEASFDSRIGVAAFSRPCGNSPKAGCSPRIEKDMGDLHSTLSSSDNHLMRPVLNITSFRFLLVRKETSCQMYLQYLELLEGELPRMNQLSVTSTEPIHPALWPLNKIQWMVRRRMGQHLEEKDPTVRIYKSDCNCKSWANWNSFHKCKSTSSNCKSQECLDR